MFCGKFFPTFAVAKTEDALSRGLRQKQTENMNRMILTAAALVCVLFQAYAQRVLTVDEMFSLAESNNRSISAYRIAEEEAAENVRVAKNGRLPSIEASLSASYLGDGWLSDRNFRNGTNAPMPHFGNNFALKATQVIYAGGAVSSEVEIAGLQAQVARLRSSDNRQDVRFLLLGYYLGIWQLRNRATVYRQNIRQTELLVEDIMAAYGQGTALKSDMTRYRLQLESLRLGLTETENDMDILNHQLATAIGLDPSVRIEVDTTFLERPLARLDEEYWQDVAAVSPAMQLADKSVEIGEESVRLARSEKLPSLAVVAGDNFDGPIVIEVPPINKNFNYWYAGIGIRYDFDALFKAGKKVRSAKAAVAKASKERDMAMEHLSNEVHSAYVKLDEAYSRLETRKTSLALAEENYEEVRYRYLNGLVLVTDMLDGSNTKLQAELDLVNARIGIVYQYCLLQRTAGLL